jgi:hypothetical protein
MSVSAPGSLGLEHDRLHDRDDAALRLRKAEAVKGPGNTADYARMRQGCAALRDVRRAAVAADDGAYATLPVRLGFVIEPLS